MYLRKNNKNKMSVTTYRLLVTLVLAGSTFAHIGPYTSSLTNFLDSSYPHPRILLLGGTGTGKSTIGNVLLGRAATAKPDKFEKTRCFHAGTGSDAVTIESCADVGKWLGVGPNVTVIDTPGFGDTTPERDGNTTEFLINLLKNEIKFIDAFVFFFNGKAARFTWSMRSMIKQFENMFGEGFWENVIFEVTFWGFSEDSIRKREINKETEASFTAGRNEKFEEYFQVKRNIGSVFIDPLFNKENKHEKNQFKKYTDKLLGFANQTTPFPCKDIKAVLAEIQEYIKKIQEKDEEIKRKQEEIEGLKNPCTPEPVKPEPRKGMSSSQATGLGFGMIILGILMGVAINFFLKSDDPNMMTSNNDPGTREVSTVESHDPDMMASNKDPGTREVSTVERE